MWKSELMEVLISISLAILLGFLGVRYSYDEVTGAVSCDQETYSENMVNNWLFEDLDSIPISVKPDLVYIFQVPEADR